LLEAMQEKQVTIGTGDTQVACTVYCYGNSKPCRARRYIPAS
jgi:hypothetical protein